MKKSKEDFISGNLNSLILRYLLFLFCFLLTTGNIYAQTKTISGIIKDEANEPLIGVTVQIKGTSNGTITDIDGRYTLAAATGNVLLFTYVGMQTQEITVGSQASIDIVMKNDSRMLAETVVIGYGSAKAKDLTSPIATIKGDDVNRHLTASPMQAMQGKVPGLQVINTGQPGS